MKKQVLSGLLVLCLIFSLLPVSAIADTAKSGTCGENLTWTLDSEGTLTISGTGAMTDYSDESKAPWFNSRSSIKSATIGNSVTSIGVEAFYDCDVLTKVTIPDSVTSIGGRAFCCCDGLTSVTIGNSVTSIEYSAFSFCSSLASVTIPDSVTSIGVEAFRGSSSLASVTIPDSVTSIGEGAFSDCDGLTSVTIGNGVTSIGDYAFFCCLSLASVTIPDSVTSIGNSAFEFCRSLTSVTIPDSVTSIGDRAFYYCTGLTEINYNAKAVTDLTSSSNVFTETGTAGSGIKVTFGDGVEKIPAYLFYTSSYDYRPNISNVSIGRNVTSIGNYAFYDCDGLTKVTIPDSVTSIGDYAFYDCYGLTSVTIGNSVTSIGDHAFYYCTGLTEINYNAKAVTDLTSSSDVFFYAGTAGSGIKVTFGDGVKKIPAYLFEDCSYLTSVTIGNSVTSIGGRAFSNCYGLTKVTIPNSVTSIGDSAFSNCYQLTEINYNAKAATDLTSSSSVFCDAGKAGSGIKVTFGEKVKKVPDYLFSTKYSDDYPKIREIVFVGNAPTIGSKSFNGVETSAYYPYGNDTWTSEVMKGYGGQITWYPYSDAEAVSVVCNGKTSYVVGDKLEINSISVTIERSDGCVETYYYDSGKITLGEYDMSKSGKQSITVTCRGVTAQLNIYIHDLTSETMPANDYPESSHNYEDNLDKTYTYTADGAYSLDVTFSNETEAETNIDYIYVNGTTYTGKELANKTLHINGDTLTVRLVSDGSDGAYGFSIDSIVATYLVHEYTDKVVAPTCTEKGYTTHTCACGDSYVADYKDALGHSFGEWTVTTAPTCTEKGVETRYCSRCDVTETRDVDALSHALVHHDGKAATCTEAGWEAYDTCSRCDYTTYKEIPATGHSYTSVVTEPTCTEQGYTTHTCACGDSYVADYKAALGHSFGEWTETTAPTCTEKGVETRYCSRCDATETREVDALGHDLVHHDGKAAACTEAGWEAYDTCSSCDYTTYKEIPATGHHHDAVVTAPTCTAKGYTTHTCACGDSYVDSYTDALGHDFGAWKQTKAPTCTEKGTETRTCTRCNASETRGVNALGHDLKHHAAKAATCTEKGWAAYDTCSRCNYTTYKEIPATDHNYTAAVTAPTCTEQGYTTYTCSCGDSYVADYKDALGHSFGEWTVTTAPTCTEKGVETRYCSGCDVTETRDVDALGHSYKSGVCTRCGAKNPNYVAAPVLKITTSAGKPQISWNAVDGATKYWIYRSTDGKTFKYYDSTTKTSYTNKSTSIGTTYYYKVKAVKTVDGTNYTSDLSGAKSILCKPAAPTVSIYRTNGKPQLKWSAVTGATKYWIYRSTDGVNFSYYDSTTKTSYTNSGAASGKKYYYRVKAVAVVNGNNVASANSGTKSLMTTLAKPTVSITTSNGKPKITWKAVTGADKYYVYRSTDGKNFSYYDSTTKLSYTNTGAKKNTKYYYKVKAICSANTNANSAYSAVVSIKATK